MKPSRKTNLSLQPEETFTPLAIDLDGTLIKEDLFFNAVKWVFLHHPILIFAFPYWLWKGKAAFKKALALRVPLNPEKLTFHAELIKKIKQKRTNGIPVVLVTGADEIYAKKIFQYLGFFQTFFASDGFTNLVSEKKATLLINKYGEKGYDYAGNSYQDIEIWKHARFSWVVNPKRGLLNEAKKTSNVTAEFKVAKKVELVNSESGIVEKRIFTNPIIWFVLFTVIIPQSVPMLINQNIITDDFRQHFMQYYRNYYPGVFQNDILIDYFQQRFAMPVHQFFFSRLTSFIEPQIASESMGILLMFATGLVMTRLSVLLTGAPVYLSLFSTILCSLLVRTEPSINWLVVCSSAQQGSFAVFFIGLFLCGFLTENFWLCLLSGVIATGVYPPAVLMILGFLALQNSTWDFSFHKKSVNSKIFIFVFIFSLLLLKIYKGIGLPSGAGPFSFSEAIQMPEFTSNLGILPFLRFDSSFLMRSIAPYKIHNKIFIIFLIGVLLYSRKRFSTASRIGFSFLIVGLCFWVLATGLFQALYEPSRYSFLAVRILLLTGIPVFIYSIYLKFSKIRMAQYYLLKLCERKVVYCLLLFSFFTSLLICGYYIAHKKGGTFLTVLPEDVYDYIKKQPLNLVVGGNPHLVVDIPIKSLHSVVAISHVLFPYDRYYYPIFKKKILDMLYADCMPDIEKLNDIKKKYGVSLFVINLEKQGTYYGGWTWLEPFRTILFEQMNRGLKCIPGIEEQAKKAIVFQSDKVAVLDLRML